MGRTLLWASFGKLRGIEFHLVGSRVKDEATQSKWLQWSHIVTEKKSATVTYLGQSFSHFTAEGCILTNCSWIVTSHVDAAMSMASRPLFTYAVLRYIELKVWEEVKSWGI